MSQSARISCVIRAVLLLLIGLVPGEKLMGLPGMILAPVVLHYIKVEASRNQAVEAAPPSAASPPVVS